jgi:transposase
MLLMTHYIGLDAHSATCTFVVQDGAGQVTQRAIVKTSETTLLGFLGSLPPGEKILAVEESHVSQWIYVLLHDHVDKMIVCNPCHLSRHQGPKTDYRDALRLANELRGNFLKPVYHDESQWIQLRVLISGYSDLVSEITRTKNRLKAVFRSEILDTSDPRFYQSKERAKELSHEHGRFVAHSLFSQVEYLEERKLEFKTIFQKNMKIYRPLKNLATIPGIDAVRANIIMAIVCMPHRFESKYKFWAYCMLVRYFQISDGKVYGSKKIRARFELKALFMGAAESAIQGESCLRKHYDDQRARGVDHRGAKISVARIIAAAALSILKNNGKFDENYHQSQTERTKLRKTLTEVTV